MTSWDGRPVRLVIAVVALLALDPLARADEPRPPDAAEPTGFEETAEDPGPTEVVPVEEETQPEPEPEPSSKPPVSDPFPFPEGLRGRVEFWKNVFAVWSTRQVALHDTDHPGLVYEVLDIPGVVGATLSREQEHFVRDRRERIQERLQRIEVFVEMGAPLADEDKELALLVATHAGTGALKDAARRVRSQRGIRDRFRRGLEISGRYETVFREIFREFGLPEDLAYLPHVESSFQASARSSAGAVGLWQFTRGAGKRFMTIGPSVDERFDPVASARGAARYLKYAHEVLGDWALAVTSYNHGIDGMARARGEFATDFDQIVREYDGKLFGFASKNFYAEFLAAREIARQPDLYFADLNFEPPLADDRVVLEANLSPHAIARKYGVPLASLAPMNPAWTRRALRSGRAIPVGTTVWLPGGTLERIASARSKKQTAPPRPVAATSAAEEAKAYGEFHRVRRGDTLSAVAARYRISVDELRRLNGLDRETSVIREGQRLRVRPEPVAEAEAKPSSSALADAMVHVVRKGETLVKIATAYGVSLADLMLVNDLTERAVIHPGQQLRVPR